jgi:hypothetical protein
MAVAPSQPCVLPSQSIAILYAAAAYQVNFLSGSGTICSATPTMNPYPDQSMVVITAQCQAPNSAMWTGAQVLAPDGSQLMLITLDSAISVSPGNVLSLSITLKWS